MYSRYRIVVTHEGCGMDQIGVRLELPPLMGFRRTGELSITIGVSDGSVNIPMTGDLSSFEDLKWFQKAVDLAKMLADKHVRIEGYDVEEREG